MNKEFKDLYLADLERYKICGGGYIRFLEITL